MPRCLKATRPHIAVAVSIRNASTTSICREISVAYYHRYDEKPPRHTKEHFAEPPCRHFILIDIDAAIVSQDFDYIERRVDSRRDVMNNAAGEREALFIGWPARFASYHRSYRDESATISYFATLTISSIPSRSFQMPAEMPRKFHFSFTLAASSFDAGALMLECRRSRQRANFMKMPTPFLLQSL